MVAAKVRDGGNTDGPVFKRLQDETLKIASATLFSPVTRQEAVQATSEHEIVIEAVWIYLLPQSLSNHRGLVD